MNKFLLLVEITYNIYVMKSKSKTYSAVALRSGTQWQLDAYMIQLQFTNASGSAVYSSKYDQIQVP
jgi:hypothetical protein